MYTHSSTMAATSSRLPHRGKPSTSRTMSHTFRPLLVEGAGSSSPRISRATCWGSPRLATASSSLWPSSILSSMSSS